MIVCYRRILFMSRSSNFSYFNFMDLLTLNTQFYQPHLTANTKSNPKSNAQMNCQLRNVSLLSDEHHVCSVSTRVSLTVIFSEDQKTARSHTKGEKLISKFQIILCRASANTFALHRDQWHRTIDIVQ